MHFYPECTKHSGYSENLLLNPISFEKAYMYENQSKIIISINIAALESVTSAERFVKTNFCGTVLGCQVLYLCIFISG